MLRQIALAVVVVIFGGFRLSLVALKYAPASIASLLAATEPVFILPIAWLWLGERVNPGAAVAACVAVAGVGLIVGSLA